MGDLILPLVEFVLEKKQDIDLSDVLLIGVQHILETTHSMFRSLYKLGLKPQNVCLIGKCYSTCKEVYDEMLEDGITVSPASFSYSSHCSFDVLYAKEIAFFFSQYGEFFKKKYKKIIVLDDGGKCIEYLCQNVAQDCPIVAIEQTTAGYEAIRNKKICFPVINVARSPLKLSLESPMIAKAAAERLYISLKARNLFPKSALIVGGGVIGQAMKDFLSEFIQITVFDLKRHRSNLEVNLIEALKIFPLIIGCTGTTSISHKLHQFLKPSTSVVSVSSSDREFDAFHLRKKIPKNNNCHADLLVNGIYLVNSGFPVNFDGFRENIASEKIQLTIALIASGILQAYDLKNFESRILSLDRDYQNDIQKQFLLLQEKKCLSV